ncbi:MULTISPECIES: hypothetical protein [Lactobacillus]|uniref:Uncharacterized protein n=1 Tax=Lactobacillus xujianguonis TaxID=2495899 RepID=A0A437SSW0_9LACO|nr:MULTISPECIES: hypothetical protein [Lactobacillus]RVU70049.1 hypothetical protein EJK17_09705 [Lactobacillus xujianguonis]
MNNKEYKKWLRQRIFERYALYFGLVWAIILLFSAILNLGLFFRLLVFQFFAIMLYYVGGWLFDAYRVVKGERLVEVHKKDNLWETITSIQLNRQFFFRIFEEVIFFLIVGALNFRLIPHLYDLMGQVLAPKTSWLMVNLNLYVSFVQVLCLALVALYLLAGKNKVVFWSAIIALLTSAVSIYFNPAMLIAEILSFIASAASIYIGTNEKI